MKKYVCDVCGWVYDEEQGIPEDGIAAGTKFDDLPDDFVKSIFAIYTPPYCFYFYFFRHGSYTITHAFIKSTNTSIWTIFASLFFATA